MRLTIAVDLDGTIAVYNPDFGTEIGKPIEAARPVLKALKKAGWYIILYTVRPDEWVLRRWCDEHFPGIFDAINCNPLDIAETGIVAAKPYANVYLDDRAWPNCGEFDWGAFWLDAVERGWV